MPNLYPTKTQSDLKALCALSNSPQTLNPQSLNRLISEAPDPETAFREVMASINTYSEVLQAKWRKIVTTMWSAKHPHLPGLLNLPIASQDIAGVAALHDAYAYLNALKHHPVTMRFENKEWLVAEPDSYYLASQIPSLNHTPLLRPENEWQYLPLRRLRATLEALRLVRRYKNQLVLIKARYEKFTKLPASHQHYLLWHAEAYHLDWSQFSGLWGEYLKIIQEYLPLLWSIGENTTPDMPHDLRRWNQDVWDSFFPLWDQERLLERQPDQTALFNLVRVHSLPTALTQVILKDLFERYGVVYFENTLFAYTSMGTKLIAAEKSEELPCALDLLQ